MSADIAAILRLEVPIVVVLGERQLRMSEVSALVPGSIIDLSKPADDELELRVNNRSIGAGEAVKVGENFGIRINFIGDLKDRIIAMGGAGSGDDDSDFSFSDLSKLAG